MELGGTNEGVRAGSEQNRCNQYKRCLFVRYVFVSFHFCYSLSRFLSLCLRFTCVCLVPHFIILFNKQTEKTHRHIKMFDF